MSAKLKLPRLISDGMVLQRNAAVKIWGWAEAGANVTVGFSGKAYSAVTVEDGKWQVTLEPMQAGGPYSMEISAGGEQITVSDILIGEVWVCSGQSNMTVPIYRTLDLFEEEVSHINNNEIRQFWVPQRYDFNVGREDLEGGEWVGAVPANIMNFGAIGYFFAAALQRKYKVPVGLINASIGGTPIEAWLSEESLRDFPVQMDELAKYKDDSFVEKVIRNDAEASASWFGELARLDKGLGIDGLPWYSDETDTSDWKTMKLPACLVDEGLKDFYGSVWFKKEIELPAEFAGLPARIRVGTIVDSDTTYVNGAVAGAISYRYPPRKYDMPAGMLKAGRNIVTVRVISNRGEGEFIKDKPYRLEIGGQVFSLEGEWKYRVGATADRPLPGTTAIQYKPAGLYNGMIYPLINYGIKGFLWYQGESNTSRPAEYGPLFDKLVIGWRKVWDQGSLPFLYVQLPNFQKADKEPGQSEWAEFREVQQRGLSIAETAMTVAHDAGEWNDLHPMDKKTVGERLALSARKLAYGEDITCSGPVFNDMKIEGNRAVISFSNVGKGLVVKGGGDLKHFAIAGRDFKFVWADAWVEGDKVVVRSGSIAEPAAVRYAWADNPEGANLYNSEGLPAASFRTDSAK